MEIPFAPRRASRRALVWTGVSIGVLAVVAVIGLAVRNAQGTGVKNAKKKAKDEASAAPVELSKAGRGQISTYLETTTVLEPRNSATLVARRPGQVVAILAEEGQRVQRGQILARLDDTEARIGLAKAEAALEEASREAERGTSLHDRGLMSERELDDLMLKQRIAQQILEQARYDLTQTRVSAPFAGSVTARRVNLGESVTPGRECFELVDLNPLLARIYFPEREQARVRVGQEATLELDARPGASFPARVTIVNPIVDRSNGTFKVTLEVTDAQGTLRPGSFARVRLKSGSFEGAILLPRKAIITEDGEGYVFIARGDSVNRVQVTVGAVSGDTAQILAGVAAGDRVVTVGQGGLKQGARIKPVSF